MKIYKDIWRIRKIQGKQGNVQVYGIELIKMKGFFESNEVRKLMYECEEDRNYTYEQLLRDKKYQEL